MSDGFARIALAAASPAVVAAEFRRGGGKVVWTLGWDIPRALVDAFGLHPVRLVPEAAADRGAIDTLVAADSMSERGRALLTAIAAIPPDDALLISHADAEQPQIFATLRELARIGAMALPPVHFLDLLTEDHPATLRYNKARLGQALAWLETLAARPPDLTGAVAAENALRAELGTLMDLRASGRLSGTEAHRLIAAAAVMAPTELLALLLVIRAEVERRPPRENRVLLSGAEIEDVGLIAEIEAAGITLVGDDHGWGSNRLKALRGDDPLDAIARSTLTPAAGPFATIATRSRLVAENVAAVRAQRVLHLRFAGSDGNAWEAEALRHAVEPLPFLSVQWPDNRDTVAAFTRGGQAVTAPAPAHPQSARKAAAVAPPVARSRKSLAVIGRFGTYQREWFARIREAAGRDELFAVVNANAPQEMLRALGVPFVVNQWWASIAAAKQQSRRYAQLLEAQGLPTAAEAYSSQGVAAAFDHDPEQAPWGGLPTPRLLGAVMTTDATSKLFETWSHVTGAPLQRFQRSVESRWDIPVDWWDGAAEDWDHFIEAERLDLFEAELRAAIAQIEAMTGRTFDAAVFAHVMDLVNEQEDFYRATRDLVAKTVPAPISVVDQMPATMVPQWHRGTEWARDAARDFHDEVAERVRNGEAACPNERIRLMFVGRGVWSDMSFYQRWEESHGAVFVCSMYLSLAADGYIRRHSRGRDPLRALAARFVSMGDELRMPTWAGAWHIKEAALHQVDGAMALSDADPLVLRALREAGVPVLELGMDNYVRDPEAEADLDRRAIEFLEGPAAAQAARRLDRKLS